MKRVIAFVHAVLLYPRLVHTNRKYLCATTKGDPRGPPSLPMAESRNTVFLLGQMDQIIAGHCHHRMVSAYRISGRRGVQHPLILASHDHRVPRILTAHDHRVIRMAFPL
jgi:hypothetical protein